jgi:Domain of unknown function (DUF4351)
VLSAIAHGRNRDISTSVRIASVAQKVIAGLDEDRSKLYYDVVMRSLTEAARQALRNMDLDTYQYQSTFARRYYSQGIRKGLTDGKQQGRAELVLRQPAVRFGPLASEVQNNINAASVADLNALAERLLTASTLQVALGKHAVPRDAFVNAVIRLRRAAYFVAAATGVLLAFFEGLAGGRKRAGSTIVPLSTTPQ